jgi:hypothetical protein
VLAASRGGTYRSMKPRATETSAITGAQFGSHSLTTPKTPSPPWRMDVRSYPRGTTCGVKAGDVKGSACGRRIVNDSLCDECRRCRRRDAKHLDVHTTATRHQHIAAFDLQRMLAVVQQQLDGSGGRPLVSLRGSEQA